jgi:hypothetical protein
MKAKAIALAVLILCSAPVHAGVLVYQAAGADAEAIQPQVSAFRSALGTNNGVSGPEPLGRREVNWDGIPLSVLDPFPGDFFRVNSPRGLVLSTPGARMKVSGDVNSPSFLMRDVTAQEWGLQELSSFSPQRFFAPIGSVITDAEFFVPARTGRAVVRGFGAVFTDIDVANATRIQAYDREGRLIFSQAVPKPNVASKGLSFLAFLFDDDQRAARVRIISGTNPIDSPFQSPPPDGVGIDDLIYAEPEAILDPLRHVVSVAAAIRAPGQNFSQWRSDLAILNPTGLPANIRVEIIQGSTVTTYGPVLMTGQQLVLPDFMGERGLSGFSTVRVYADQPVKVTESIYNNGSSTGGNFGLNLRGLTPDETLQEGQVAFLPQLRHDARERTNLGLTNTGTTNATVNVTLFDGNGTAVSTYDVSVAPNEVVQENNVFFARTGRSDFTTGSARVVVKFGSGIIAYASANDNSTGDPRVIEMQIFQ